MAARHPNPTERAPGIPAERRYVIGSAPAATPGGTPPRPDWREEVISASGLNVLVGIWLVISPWVIGYTSADAWWNPIVCGAIVAVFALVRAAGAFRAEALSVMNMAVGGWLFASAFWLASSSQAKWNVGIAGVVIFMLAGWSLGASGDRLAEPPAVR